jgi:hypothetical protein
MMRRTALESGFKHVQPEHLAILKQGVEVWNRWRDEERGVTPDLSRADLEDEHLETANLQKANLKRVNLRGANLTKANLDWSNLVHGCLSATVLNGATLTDAYLLDADLHRADLRDADFRGAHLAEVNLSFANLNGADFTNSLVSRLLLCEVDLSQTKGLAAMQHAKRSSIDVATLQLSRTTLPESFLRGVGLTDQFIAYWRSLSTEAIEFYSTFISYSTKDQEFADRFHADLQNRGVRCWFAPEDLKIGDPFRQRIDESIRLHDKLLLILSEQSVRSTWVLDELEAALERERRENRLVLFPIRIDDTVMEAKQAWAAAIRRTRHIGDFSKWKDHDSYQTALQRLLRDLKANAAEVGTK